MSKRPRATLDQWRAFLAVVETDSYLGAAEKLHLSQSTISHAVSRLQDGLDLELLEIKGRKSHLTDIGHQLVSRANQLLDDALYIEQLAREAASGVETEIVIAVDAPFPTTILLDALESFRAQHSLTRVQVREEVMSGVEKLINSGKADIGIGPSVPETANGQVIWHSNFIPVASPDHPLHQVGNSLTRRDLVRYPQIFIRDTGEGNLESEMESSTSRWTVSHKSTALEMVKRGMGYSWMPMEWIRDELESGRLKELETELRQNRSVPMYLVTPSMKQAGTATKSMIEILRQHAHENS